jgi:hypothetical protein
MPLPGEGGAAGGAGGGAPPQGANEWVRNLMQYLGRQPDQQADADANNSGSDSDA